jgi:kinesin family protein 1
MGDHVRVAVRVRPFNHRESERNARLIVSTNGPQTTITNPETEETRTFTFDYSYWSHDEFEEEEDGLLIPISEKYADQRRIFDDLGSAVLTNANKGFNCSVLTYGQTGSGKSYTMAGRGANRGLVPHICDALFRQIEENLDPKLEFQVRISMLEVYNEKVRDLLSRRNLVDGLKVRQHPKLGVQVVGLTEVAVGSCKDLDRRIEEGTQNRTIAVTRANAVSSRGHTVVTICLTKIEKDVKGPGRHKEQLSKITLVDLAGSDRLDGAEAGDRLREGSAINLSLAMLQNVSATPASRGTFISTVSEGVGRGGRVERADDAVGGAGWWGCR